MNKAIELYRKAVEIEPANKEYNDKLTAALSWLEESDEELAGEASALDGGEGALEI